ncbi:MAG: MOSC domain-containing protein [Candidatus Eremiobacteraeota bacterium]|nr:MOSC domain-containing protein [Candidatus Eremiobacteraeota bacterium]
MLIGTLLDIRRYPVKSLGGQKLERTQVEPEGVAGDRVGALVVRGGHARIGKTYRGKEHDRLHLLSDERAAIAAAAARGTAVEMHRGDRFFDDAPVSLLVDRWLDDLNEHLGYRVEWERFRPNFFVQAARSFAQTESELVGAQLRLGEVRLRVRSPIERCVAVTYHPSGEPSDPRILRYLAQSRNAWMGIYCEVLEPGATAIGDELEKEAPLQS